MSSGICPSAAGRRTRPRAPDRACVQRRLRACNLACVHAVSFASIPGVPNTENGRLVGILTNRDLRFETRFHLPIRKVMTKENLVTVPVETTLDEAQRILHKHRIEKLLVVDKDQNLKGLITVKDI